MHIHKYTHAHTYKYIHACTHIHIGGKHQQSIIVQQQEKVCYALCQVFMCLFLTPKILSFPYFM